MKHEVGRRVLPDGSILVQFEEPIAGDFGQRQSFETLGADGLPLNKEFSSEQTPGEVISSLAQTAIDPRLEQAE